MLKTIKSLSVLAISDLGSGAISSVFWLFLASLLPTGNYGEIQVLISIAAIGGGISMIATNNTIMVYEVKQKELRGILFLFSVIISAIVSVGIFILYSKLELVMLTFLMIFGEMISGYFLGKKKFVKYGIFQILQKAIMIPLSLILYYLIGLEGIIYGVALSYIPSAIQICNSLKQLSINFSLIKENFGFIINNYAVRLFSTFRKNFDKIVIVPLLGLETVGEFALGLQVFMVMTIFAQMSYKILLVYDAEGRNTTKLNMALIFSSCIIAILGITLGPVVIPALFPNFTNTIEIIPILSLAVISNAINLIFSSKFLGNEKSRFTLIGTIIQAATYLLLIVLLGAAYGLY
ncbi:MAG TPA: hypothetical protein VFM31_08625, partial [Nitrososphaeraceae archaeon]|nr:hypothetical protein [Nitrososphaeraceae archaeon]